MSYTAQGVLIAKFPTQQVTDKFKKQEFVIRMPNPHNGQEFPQVIQFQLSQANCGKIDQYNVGDNITVHFNLKGKEYEKNGKKMYFNSIDAWKIERDNSGSQQPQQQAPQQNYQQPQQGYQQPQQAWGDPANTGDLPF